ncbi:MAG: hypothetical protein IJP01_02315 [Oscillospiraceae bacterium]|nr:hypothetical protein [Oscillospiraceae bacterium]
MHIYVKSPDLPIPIRLRLPNALFTNRFAAAAIAKAAAAYGAPISQQRLYRLLQTASRCRRSHPKWNLVEVDTASGEHIRITL